MAVRDVDGPLSGWSILIPRGGEWGNSAAELVRAHGATPVIAPLIDFAEPQDQHVMADGLRQLAEGAFDWLVVTSATTVRSLTGVDIPPSTRVAAVGPATAAALAGAGMPVDLVPDADFSAGTLADALAAQTPTLAPDQNPPLAADQNPTLAADLAGHPGAGVRIFLPQSASADPALANSLRGAGYEVLAAAAYRTVSVPAASGLSVRLRSGEPWAILVTSGSVAREIAEQLTPFPPAPEATVALLCIGARTEAQARALGLPVAAVAATQSVTSMLDSLIPIAKEHS